MKLVEKYVSLKTGVRHNTVAGYKTVINILKKESFGRQRIDKVRLADISVTLNTYTYVKFDDVKDKLLRVANA